jgi:5-enolpyruvylshikimate-3-phosphate synthase
MRWRVSRSVLHGRLRVPGDKSIAHRAVMLAGLADGTSRLQGMPRGADVLSTAECLRLLGARIVLDGETAEITAEGRLLEPLRPLDAGNSGTTIRLLSGILAGQPFSSIITGDESLRRRPMRRVIEPLSQMGAHIDSIDGRAPLIIEGAPLRAIQYALPVASAQVKSAVLLAGLFADEVPRLIDELPLVALLATQASGTSTIRGAGELRHKETDRIAAVASALATLGAAIRELPDGFVIRGPTPLRSASVSSSGDHRLAMMLAVAGSIAHGETVIDGVESADISYPEFARHFAGLEGALDAA